MIFNEKSLLSINEVYFGKTPELQKIEKQLGIFRSKYLGKYLLNIRCNSDPDLLKFNRMIEDYFGFGCFSLTIVNQPIENAYTVPLDIRYDVINTNKNLLADKNGFKFNKKADYACLCYIYSGIIFNPTYTDEECMAVILHEIGHNFYSALDKSHAVLSNLFSVLIFIMAIWNMIIDVIRGKINTKELKSIFNLSIGNTNLAKKFQANISQYMRKNSHVIIVIYDIFKTFGNIATTLHMGIYSIIDFVTFGLSKIFLALYTLPFNIYNPLKYVLWLRNIPNEKLADNFCTMYGYGAAQASVLQKLTSVDLKDSPSKLSQAYSHLPLMSTLWSINTSIANIILEAFDEHPTCLSRTKDQLDMLEREAAKEDLDPKMRKVILADAEACKKVISQLIDTSDGVENKDIIKAAYYKSLYETSNCKQLKDILYDEINKFDVYDKTYEEKLNQGGAKNG